MGQGAGDTVDADELALVMREMAACQRALVELAGEVEAETTRLHGAWSGLSRDAHATSYGVWRDGFARMVPALAGMRALSEGVRRDYAEAVEADIALWEKSH